MVGGNKLIFQLIKTLFVLFLLGLSLWWLVRKFERSRIYYPQRFLEATPHALGLDYEEIAFTASDGVRLHGWWVPAESSRATLIFCHGNAGNISHRLESIRVFNSLGLDVFIFDYRGYGQSAGKPSEAGTYLDAAAAYAYVTETLRVPPERIVIFGRSLGGAVAVQLALDRAAAALICEASFTSTVELGKRIYPYFPAKLLVFDRYDSISKVGGIKTPQLFIHRTEDELVPFQQGKRLHQAAAQPKEFLEIRGSHGGGFLEDEEAYRRGLSDFLRKYLPPAG